MTQHMRVPGGYCLLLMVVALVLSCGKGKYGETIPSKKFINLLVDIHLADGIAVENMSQAKGPVFDSAALYGSVFSKYEVTRAMFDSTMSFYSEHPDDFQKVYNKVTAKLKRMEDELNAQQTEEIRKLRGGAIDTILKK